MQHFDQVRVSETMQERDRPICPKCGYDQTGEIATWDTQCPIRGICTECGLEFNWSNVMRPELGQVPWYVEHAKGVRRFIWRSVRTPFHLILPHRFWNQLDPAKPVSIVRLILWLILMVFIVHTLVGIPNGYNAWIRSNWLWGQVAFPQYVQMSGNYAYAEMLFDGYFYPYLDAWPQASSHKWTLDVHWGWYFRTDPSFSPHFASIGMLLLWSIVLLAIPHTRRLAKLRKRHVVRAIILSIFMIVMSYELTHLIRTMFELEWIPRSIFPVLDGLPALFCWVWLLVFWGCAVHIGWLIRPSRLLIALGTIASILGGTTLSVYVFIIITT